MWDRWQQGESLQAIAQLFGRNHSSVAGVLSKTGESYCLLIQQKPLELGF